MSDKIKPQRWHWKNWAMINECSADISSVAFHAQDSYIDYLETENEILRKEKKHFCELYNKSLDREIKLLKELGRDPGDY